MAKARTYLPDFQSIKIPLPPLETQHAIVSRWKEAQRSTAKVEEKIVELEKQIEKRFFADLGVKFNEFPIRPKFFAVKFSELNQWGVRQTTDNLLGLDHLEAKFPIVNLGDFSTVSYGIQKSPANRDLR